MSQSAGGNPWLSMWGRPTSTIRSIIHTDPKYGVFYLASLYALQDLLFFANWWSLGLSYPFYAILIASLILAPIIGMAWLYFAGWVFQFTGKWLGGKAPALHVRAALAWSYIPIAVSVVMWFVLLAAHADFVFILDAGGPSSLFINFITVILSIWSLVLLIQSIREIQGFTILRSLANVIVARFLSSFFLFFLFNIVRYFYMMVK